jgi:hypothetical protein
MWQIVEIDPSATSPELGIATAGGLWMAASSSRLYPG